VLPCVDVFVVDEFCIWATILRTCLALRWGAQLADVRTCLAFALRTSVGAPKLPKFKKSTLVRPYYKVYLQAKICSYPSSSSSFSLVLPCVYVFVAYEFCVWETILRKCLAFRCGTQLADVRTCLPLWKCLAFALRTCVGAPNLRTCLALRWGAQLADMPCVAFGRPCCGCALRCIGVPKLGEAVLKSLPPRQNLFLSILQLVF
jgi:hypothetical protein